MERERDSSDDEGGMVGTITRRWKMPVVGAVEFGHCGRAIGCWEQSIPYVFWRPITAIPLADTDGNPATTADPTWMPLFATPRASRISLRPFVRQRAAGSVLAHYFGERTRFSVTSDVMPGVVRSFDSFSKALDEVKNARIFAGIHFRSATNDGQTLGASVGWVRP